MLLFLKFLFELSRALWIYELYGLLGITFKCSIRNWACIQKVNI